MAQNKIFNSSKPYSSLSGSKPIYNATSRTLKRGSAARAGNRRPISARASREQSRVNSRAVTNYPSRNYDRSVLTQSPARARALRNQRNERLRAEKIANNNRLSGYRQEQRQRNLQQYQRNVNTTHAELDPRRAEPSRRKASKKIYFNPNSRSRYKKPRRVFSLF